MPPGYEAILQREMFLAHEYIGLWADLIMGWFHSIGGGLLLFEENELFGFGEEKAFLVHVHPRQV